MPIAATRSRRRRRLGVLRTETISRALHLLETVQERRQPPERD
jgi:hypothetical protein